MHKGIVVDGMSLKEVSRKYDIPFETVRARYYRGIHELDGLTNTDNLKNHKYRIDRMFGAGKKFMEVAIDKDISMAEMERRTGISRSAIWNFVYNKGDISSMKLAKLCNMVGCSMDYVMGLQRDREVKA